ncbi:Abi family protein [Curtobacterium sp. RRHDQ10]|uniref:Abi family protein n=1 Tax=Curtobacterium phyllosphaerae TaxID=3413379 RepID=UPI003BF1DA8B
MTSDDWFVEWVSIARFERYLRAAGHDQDRARRLYDWNARLAGAFLQDLAHLEVGLRNAYDRALQGALIGGDSHWSEPGTTEALFPVDMRRSRASGTPRDVNAIARRRVAEAVDRARAPDGGRPPSGKVVAEFTFGFWTMLTSDRLERSIWRPHLHTAYGPRSHRDEIRDALEALRRFRNRVAHHECILGRPELQHRRLMAQVRRIDPRAEADLSHRSLVAELLRDRP